MNYKPQVSFILGISMHLNGKNTISIRENFISTIYNMSGRVVSVYNFGESLYIRYNTDANVVNDLKNDSSYEFIGEVILKINVV
jgi:hypothetical protein